MDCHWTVGQEGERKKGPSCHALCPLPRLATVLTLFLAYPEVQNSYLCSGSVATSTYCPRSFFRPWKGGLRGHASLMVKPHQMALGSGDGGKTDGQKKEWVEEEVAAMMLDSASCSGGSCGDELGHNSRIINICEEKRTHMSSF